MTIPAKIGYLGLGLAIAAIICALLLLSGCGGGEASLPKNTVYEGKMYGDMIPLFEQVKACKRYIGFLEPTVIIYDHPFDCTGTLAVGCYLLGQVGMWNESLIKSHGSLWSHELTHFFQSLLGEQFREDDPCGNFMLPDFKL